MNMAACRVWRVWRLAWSAAVLNAWGWSATAAETEAVAGSRSSADRADAPMQEQLKFELAEDEAFPYAEPAQPQWLRLSIEQLGLLALGSGYYFSERRVNSLDWEFGYSWSTLQRKLVGDGYAFDDNYFNTNYLSHPGSGALYYSVARANHVGVPFALLTAFFSSAVWEVLGEFRERVSINDSFVTPIGGFAFGESMVQIGAFFDRSCDTLPNRILGSLFATAKSAHDRFDRVTLVRGPSCDRYGLTRVGEHRFRFWLAGNASATQLPNSGTSSVAVGASAEITNLRALGQPGRAWSTFSGGNFTQLSASGRLDAWGLAQAQLRTRAIPVGIHTRAIERQHSLGVGGSEWLVGLGAGLEYMLHRYAPAREADRFFVIDAPAWFMRWRKHQGLRRLELEMTAAGALGGVTAFAQQDYVARNALTDLTQVAQSHGYNHVFGVAISPVARWITPTLELSFEARADRLFGALAPDAGGATHSRVAIRETRRSVRLGAIVHNAGGPSWINSALLENRAGSVGPFSRSVVEFSLQSGVLVQY